jgi:hypothetical protein
MKENTFLRIIFNLQSAQKIVYFLKDQPRTIPEIFQLSISIHIKNDNFVREHVTIIHVQFGLNHICSF